MVPKCCIRCCQLEVTPDTITFPFPKDPTLRYRWIMALQRPAFVPTSRSVVCSQHFLPKEIDTTGGGSKLTSGAVPSVALAQTTNRQPLEGTPEDVVHDFGDFKRHARVKLNLGSSWFVHVRETVVHYYSIDAEFLRSPIRVKNDIKVYPSLAIRVFVRDVEKTREELEPWLGKCNKIVRWSQLRKVLEEYDDTKAMSRMSAVPTITDIPAEVNERVPLEDGGAVDSDDSDPGAVSMAKPTVVVVSADKPPPLIKKPRPPKPPGRSIQRNRKCYICNRDHENDKEYELHLSEHYKMLPYRCELCTTSEIVLHTVCLVNQHFRMHQKPVKCRYCDVRLTSIACRNTHELRQHVHSEGPVICDVCGKQSSSYNAHQYHMKIHIDPEAVRCKICNRCLSSTEELRMHMAAHTGERKFKCAVCDKMFIRRSTLVAHRRTHNSEPQFKCDKCGSRFSTKTTLKKHLETHQLGVELTCKVCNKALSTLARFNKHLLKHEKKWQCDVCDYKTKRRRYFIDHQNSHTGETPHLCKHCNMSFRTYSTLKWHMKQHRSPVRQPEPVEGQPQIVSEIRVMNDRLTTLPVLTLIPKQVKEQVELTPAETTLAQAVDEEMILVDEGAIPTTVTYASVYPKQKQEYSLTTMVPEVDAEELVSYQETSEERVTVQWDHASSTVDTSTLMLSYPPGTIYYYTPN